MCLSLCVCFYICVFPHSGRGWGQGRWFPSAALQERGDQGHSGPDEVVRHLSLLQAATLLALQRLWQLCRGVCVSVSVCVCVWIQLFRTERHFMCSIDTEILICIKARLIYLVSICFLSAVWCCLHWASCRMSYIMQFVHSAYFVFSCCFFLAKNMKSLKIVIIGMNRLLAALTIKNSVISIGFQIIIFVSQMCNYSRITKVVFLHPVFFYILFEKDWMCDRLTYSL